MSKVLIIEDEVAIADLEKDYLELSGFEVEIENSGDVGLEKALQEEFDMYILDLMLPGLPGEEILPKIKEIPVIVLSAKADVKNKVRLLLNGAADYMTKPFDAEELLARVAVQLRNGGKNQSDILTFEDLSLNDASHGFFVGEAPVKLTKTEYAIMKLLMINAGQIITKSAILDKISEDTPDCVEGSLKVHISNLRNKIEDEPKKPEMIRTVKGLGYRFEKEQL